MTGPLICARCGEEILPGSRVRFIGADPETERIVYEDDAIALHYECPEESTTVATTDESALDLIYRAMAENEWNADLWDVVAAIVRSTGREFRPEDEETNR